MLFCLNIPLSGLKGSNYHKNVEKHLILESSQKLANCLLSRYCANVYQLSYYITFDFISFKTIELVKIAADLLTSTIILTVGKVVAIFCGWGGRIVTGTQPEVKNKTFYKHGVYFAGVVILVLEQVCGFMVINTTFNNITVTVKPVYSGHLGEFDKMTTIDR